MFNWTHKWRNLETGCPFSLFNVKTITMHNTCEVFLLAAPIILDLVLLAELSNRIRFRKRFIGSQNKLLHGFHFSEPWFWVLFWRGSFISFHSVDTIVSYLTNAPLVPPGTWVVSILYKCLGWLDHNFIIAL